jgi:hypothetical protein
MGKKQRGGENSARATYTVSIPGVVYAETFRKTYDAEVAMMALLPTYGEVHIDKYVGGKLVNTEVFKEA